MIDENSTNSKVITILGSGTCVPSLERSSCSVLVEVSGQTLLFDIGAGTMRRLLEAGKSIDSITHLFVSHHHPDHTGELASFLFALKYPELKRKKRPLTLIAGRGFTSFYNRLYQVYGEWIDPGPDMLRIIELDTMGPDRLESEGFSISSVPVEHREESLAYRIDIHEKSIIYSGDTDYCESLTKLAASGDVLICECSTPDHLKMENHMTPSLAGKTASVAGVKKLILTHFYPECDKSDIAKECRKTYDGDLALAQDLMRIRL